MTVSYSGDIMMPVAWWWWLLFLFIVKGDQYRWLCVYLWYYCIRTGNV